MISDKILWDDHDIQDSFNEYIHIVYGEDPPIAFKNLDAIYRRSDISFRFNNYFKLQNWLLDPHLHQHIITFDNKAYYEQKGHYDYEWVEVTRGSTSCHINYYEDPVGIETEEKKKLEDSYSEGFSKGFPRDVNFSTRTPQPYGCWFYMLSGTGIYVNIGKSLVAHKRSNALQMLGLPCPDPPHCYFGPDDFNICIKVIEKGYDSMQIFESHDRNVHELVYCTGNCATQSVNTSCPPLELRTGWNGTKKCSCSENYPILNCNNKITDVTDCHKIQTEKYRIKQTCYFEDFNWMNEFSTSWDGSIAIFLIWDRHGVVETFPKVKSVLDEFHNGGWSTILVHSGDFTASRVLNLNYSYILKSIDDLGFDIVPILRKSERSLYLERKSQSRVGMLSLTLPGLLRSTVVKKAGVKIGFISYTFYKMNIDKIDDMVQIIIDEALCLKRLSDIIVLISSSEIYVDTYIFQKVNKFVDIILGGNSDENKSCDNKWHTNNDSVIIHCSRDSSFLTMVSIDVIDKRNYGLKSRIIDLMQWPKTL